MVRTVLPWNSIDLPGPVGKTPKTSWPFRIDSKHVTWRGLKLRDGKWSLLRENPTQRSTDKNSDLPALMRPYANLVHPQILGVLVVMWPADARVFSRPTSKARERASRGRGWEPMTKKFESRWPGAKNRKIIWFQSPCRELWSNYISNFMKSTAFEKMKKKRQNS